MATFNTQALPTQPSRTRFDFEGQTIEVVLDWRVVRGQAYAALANKSRRSKKGPVSVLVVTR